MVEITEINGPTSTDLTLLIHQKPFEAKPHHQNGDTACQCVNLAVAR